MDSMALRFLDEDHHMFRSPKGAKQIVARASEYSAEDADVALRLNDQTLAAGGGTTNCALFHEKAGTADARGAVRIERNGVLIDLRRCRSSRMILACRSMRWSRRLTKPPANRSIWARPSSSVKSCSASWVCR